MAKKKECFGIMNETVSVKYAVVKILGNRKILFMTDVTNEGIDKGSVGWEKDKQAYFFDDRFSAEKMCCLLACKNTYAFVLEVPDYYLLESFKNQE